ncbi:hypothetical protein V6N00_13405 [Tersicoccus sp. MR15.9]|uniref:hypothetical protein n=1 Tax=Tersicoccus mangrovi TaxID=3121635 RepID=UPI002FE58B86
MSTLAMRPRRRTLLIVGAVVAVAVGAAAVVALLIGAGIKNAAPSRIPDLIPASSDTAVLTPAGKDWWTKVAGMYTADRALVLAAPPADLKLVGLGYSHGPDPVKRNITGTGALRQVYLEAPDAQSAVQVGEWAKSIAVKSDRVSVEGTVVTISPLWVDKPVHPTQPLSQVPGYRSRDGKDATMWRNPGQDAATAVTDRTAVAATFTRSAFGFKDGTTWNGTSTDGGTWTGHFATGGVDKTKIDLSLASYRIASTEKTIATVGGTTLKGAQTTSTARIFDPGMDVLLNRSWVATGSQSIGANPGGLVANIPSVNQPLVSAKINQFDWEMAKDSNTGSATWLASQSISANEHDMTVGLTFTDPNAS